MYKLLDYITKSVKTYSQIYKTTFSEFSHLIRCGQNALHNQYKAMVNIPSVKINMFQLINDSTLATDLNFDNNSNTTTSMVTQINFKPPENQTNQKIPSEVMKVDKEEISSECPSQIKEKKVNCSHKTENPNMITCNETKITSKTNLQNQPICKDFTHFKSQLPLNQFNTNMKSDLFDLLQNLIIYRYYSSSNDVIKSSPNSADFVQNWEHSKLLDSCKPSNKTKNEKLEPDNKKLSEPVEETKKTSQLLAGKENDPQLSSLDNNPVLSLKFNPKVIYIDTLLQPKCRLMQTYEAEPLNCKISDNKQLHGINLRYNNDKTRRKRNKISKKKLVHKRDNKIGIVTNLFEKRKPQKEHTANGNFSISNSDLPEKPFSCENPNVLDHLIKIYEPQSLQRQKRKSKSETDLPSNRPTYDIKFYFLQVPSPKAGFIKTTSKPKLKVDDVVPSKIKELLKVQVEAAKLLKVNLNQFYQLERKIMRETVSQMQFLKNIENFRSQYNIVPQEDVQTYKQEQLQLNMKQHPEIVIQ